MRRTGRVALRRCRALPERSGAGRGQAAARHMRRDQPDKGDRSCLRDDGARPQGYDDQDRYLKPLGRDAAAERPVVAKAQRLSWGMTLNSQARRGTLGANPAALASFRHGESPHRPADHRCGRRPVR